MNSYEERIAIIKDMAHRTAVIKQNAELIEEILLGINPSKSGMETCYLIIKEEAKKLMLLHSELEQKNNEALAAKQKAIFSTNPIN